MPAPGGLSFGASATANTAPTSLASSAAAATETVKTTLTVPAYVSIFPASDLWDKLVSLLETSLSATTEPNERLLAGEELSAMLCISDPAGTILVNPPILECHQPSMALRQQLQQNPMVDLDGQTAALSMPMFQQVLQIADDLRISEADALRVFAHVGRTSSQQANMLDAARQLYFGEKSKPLQVLFLLLTHRLECPDGHPLLVATDLFLTDGGLMGNLMTMIRKYTQSIHEMLLWMHTHQRSHMQPYSPESTGDFNDTLSYHLRFWLQQRQRAAECLFFIAYQVQLEASEVCGTVDLIRDLTNASDTHEGLRVLDPYFHVPSPYEADEQSSWSQLQGAPVVDKSYFQWQHDLVTQMYQSGQPWLLRSVGTLITAVISSLNGKRGSFHNRHTHSSENRNTLCQQTQSLASSLGMDVISKWQRSDIIALLISAYSLLQPETKLGSPPSGRSKQWRMSLETPTTYRSFTFARLTLIPALKVPLVDEFRFSTVVTKNGCDVSEFLLIEMSNFASAYLDKLFRSGDRPISRAQWQQDAEEDLRIRQLDREQEQQFQMWSKTQKDLQSVPTSIDLCNRPDCMDDVVMFCVNLCSLGPYYAVPFWSEVESSSVSSEDVDVDVGVDVDADEGEEKKVKEMAIVTKPSRRFVPSNALMELERQQDKDDTLRPCYLSFLAALAQSSLEDGIDGAAAVHGLMMQAPDPSLRCVTTYASLLEVCRWYCQQLTQLDASSSSRGVSATVNTSTSYYYNAASEGLNYRDPHQDDAAASQPKDKELGEDNTFLLLSNLLLLTNLAKNSVAARLAILSVQIPVPVADRRDIMVQGPTLRTLFSLACTALSPEVRGAVFDTIAVLLLPVKDGKRAEESKEMAMLAWELLEETQLLPIYLLDQYPSTKNVDVYSAPRLSFPPSSTVVSHTRFSALLSLFMPVPVHLSSSCVYLYLRACEFACL
jgi:Nuclear pore complex scaffold, nucleoporins 186/192/205